MISLYSSKNSHTLFQCEDSITFKYMDGEVENGDVSSGYGSMNIHTDLQRYGLKSLINYNDRNYTDMNDNLQNGDVSSGIGLLNSHTLPQDNESIKLNDVNIGAENDDINGDYCYINISTGYESNNHNTIDYTKKSDEFSTNRYYLMENNGFPDGVVIDVVLPASALNQYDNMEYNNEHNKLLSNGSI